MDAAKLFVKDISWYVPHFVPNLESQQLVLNQVLNKDPTELYYTERTVFRKDVNTNDNWTFELGNNSGSNCELSTPFLYLLDFKLERKLIHKHIIMQHMIG